MLREIQSQSPRSAQTPQDESHVVDMNVAGFFGESAVDGFPYTLDLAYRHAYNLCLDRITPRRIVNAHP